MAVSRLRQVQLTRRENYSAFSAIDSMDLVAIPELATIRKPLP
jgi:predicted chitinase